MTLTKAIEALKVLEDAIEERHASEESSIDNMNIGHRTYVEIATLENTIYKCHLEAIETVKAALPDKPMTEEEIIEIIATKGDYTPSELDRREAKYVFNKLKAANALYVEEGK